MQDAFIFDAVRTPRGRGRSEGSLNDVTALSLAAQILQAVRDRNALDTRMVDDVIFGCVAPTGEQGGNIARIAVLTAGYAGSLAIDGSLLNWTPSDLRFRRLDSVCFRAPGALSA